MQTTPQKITIAAFLTLVLCFFPIHWVSTAAAQGLRTVALSGEAAPGMNGGVNFSRFLGASPLLNSAGQVAFIGILTGTEVDGSNNQSIWSEGGGSGLALVVRAGDTAPGTSDNISFSSLSSTAQAKWRL